MTEYHYRDGLGWLKSRTTAFRRSLTRDHGFEPDRYHYRGLVKRVAPEHAIGVQTYWRTIKITVYKIVQETYTPIEVTEVPLVLGEDFMLKTIADKRKRFGKRGKFAC